MRNTKRSRKIIILLMAVSLSVMGMQISSLPKAAAAKSDVNQKELSKPTCDDAGNVVWDCIYFGNYLQSEVTYLQTTQDNYEIWQILSGKKEDPKEKIQWDGNGDAVYKSIKYHRAYKKVTKWDDKKGMIVTEYVPHYYRLEPIKWRVLSVNGNDTFVVSDKALDCKPYNVTDDTAAQNLAVTWETCTLRSWLNGYGSGSNTSKKDFSKDNFINTAFSKEEQSIIWTSSINEETNPETEISSGNSTSDKLFLLSAAELTNKAYGFDAISKDTTAGTSSEEVAVASRVCANTGWATQLGAVNSGGSLANVQYSTGWYWLRLPGRDTSFSAFMSYAGNVDYTGAPNSTSVFGVRPAMHVNLENVSGKTLWKYAGTVDSTGKANEPKGSGLENGTGTNGGTGSKKLPSAGTSILDSKSGLKYRILTSTAKSKTVAFTGVLKQKKKLTIPASIKYSGYTYKVVSIDAKAMQKKSNLTSLTIGKNIQSIEKKAFKNCKKLKLVIVKSRTLRKVGKKAFAGTSKKLKVTLPKGLSKSQKKKYKKLFKGKGNKKLQVK